MTEPATTRIHCPDEAATIAVAKSLAMVLTTGDTLLLQGGLGAGKSLFARTIIQHLLAAHGLWEDVPSPTFTLVQEYQTGDLVIQHADLYRIGNSDEIDELGLGEALGRDLCLIEWPDRLGGLTPPDALTLSLTTPTGDHDARDLEFTATSLRWANALSDLSPRFATKAAK